MANVARVTAANFGNEVLSSLLPVMVDVYAPWCGPCRILAPVLEKFADEFAGTVRIVKVNIDEEPEVARVYGITSVPTLLFFRNGQLADRVTGLPSLDLMKAKLNAIAPRVAK